MAGITDSAFREVCRSFGAAFTMSEMVSAEGLFHKKNKSRSLMTFSPAERPYGIQLFGNEADKLARATEAAAELSPDFIDLNCGCPAKKVLRSGSGAALMGDLGRLESIMKAMRDSVKLPLTVKIRSGLKSSDPSAVEAAQLAEDCGFDAVIVHPRAVSQSFSGKADWNLIGQVKEAITLPVIGNGDIASPEDAERMLKTTGCDIVMVGRAARGQPWIFARINEKADEPTSETRLKTIRKHYRLMIERKGEHVGVREMRKHLIWYSRGLTGAADFRRRVVRLDSSEDALGEIERFFAPGRIMAECA